MLQSGEWTDIGSFKAASFTSGFCTDRDFPPTSAEVRAVARDPVVAGEQCSHIGCFWQSNAAKGHNKRASVQAHERSPHSHNDHFKSHGKSCCACLDLIKAGLWSLDKNGDLTGNTRPVKRKRADSVSVTRVGPPIVVSRSDEFRLDVPSSPDSDWSRSPSESASPSDESDATSESSCKRRRLELFPVISARDNSPSNISSDSENGQISVDSDSELDVIKQFLALVSESGDGRSRWAETLRGLALDLKQNAGCASSSPNVDACRRVLQSLG